MSSRKKDVTREEIMRKFTLPERQSKIDTLLKQDGQEYCICRSSDSSRFMIACDACEEWYHGDCIHISEREAKNIKRFFCVRCREEDPSLVTRYRTSATGSSSTADSRNKSTDHSSDKSRSQTRHEDKKRKHGKSAVNRCGQCVGCYKTENCDRCKGCNEMRKYGWTNKASKTKCKQRMCINTGQSGAKKHRRVSEEKDSGPPPVHPKLLSSEPRQCYGPRCTKIARFGAKYCSDECGLNLATNRIYQVLPPRIQEWSLSPCEAEEQNKRSLDKIRAHQQQVRRKLEELDLHHKQLDAIIQRGKQQTIDPRAIENQTSEDDTDTSMYCITCGHEIHNRTAIRHMEKCFNKFEAQASFGSVFKTRIEGNVLFCDFFNATNRTYCKRLKVLCPEHCKDPKVRDDEVCGCPLVRDVFEQVGGFCRAAKKACIKHYAWEKLFRAEIDIERVRQWLKIDELIEQERQIRHAMTNRAGVLALMLHSTYNHELMEKLASAKDQEAVQKELMKRFRKT